MKGLLQKDFRLMVKQSKFFSTIAFITVIFAGVVENISFIISYLTFIGFMFTLSTISYDEFDNGNAFLFSLPITRRGYVVEKYGFGLLMGGSCWIFATLIAVVCGQVRRTNSINDSLAVAFMIIPVMLLLLAIILPFQLKFGGEKGRIAAIAMVGIVFIVFLGVAKITKTMHIDLSGLLNRIETMDTRMLGVAAIAVSIGVLLLSGRISVTIMEKKEF